jgi:SAM-dependent methyltransferase
MARDQAPLPPLKIRSSSEQQEIVMAHLRQQASAREINILEAGCGRRWPFSRLGATYRLTGVDMDKAALDVRQKSERDLHEAILGDLRSVELMPAGYDVIYNSYVLEHVNGAERVLHNFLRWLKPGGFLIITIPDRNTAYGFVARSTPHWFHVLFYRHILGKRNAGRPGNVPYPTFYDNVVSRAGVREFARKNHLEILEECGFYKPGGIVGVFIDFVALMSFGRLASTHCNLLYVLEKATQTSS